MRHAPAGRAAQRGVSIIELMVALVLGMLVVVGVGSAFVSTRQIARSTDSLGQMQDSMRTSYELIARDLREAGGNLCDVGLLTANVLNAAQGANPAWWANWGEQLRGFDAGDAFAAAPIGAGVGQRVDGTDAVMAKFVVDLGDLTVTAHDPATATLTVNASPHRVLATDVVLVCDYRQAAVFSASAVTATTVVHGDSAGAGGNCSRGLGLPTACTAAGTAFTFNAGAKIGRIAAVGWYVGHNGRAASGGRSLYRVTRDGAEEIAEGVQDMQISYLVRNGNDYVAAGAVADWADVVGLRFVLTLAGTDATAATAGGRLQRSTSFTLSLRNRLS